MGIYKVVGRLLIGFAIFGITASVSIAADKPKEEAKERVTIKLPNANSRVKGSNKKYDLDYVIMYYKDTKISFDKGSYDDNANKKYGRFTNNVRVTQPDVVLTSNILETYFKEEKATATGSVVILREEDRKNDTGKVERVKTTVNSDKADFSTSNKDFSASGNVVVVDKGTKAWADNVVYTDNDKKLSMTGKVKIERDDGSIVISEKVVYYTDREYIDIMGPAEMTTLLD